MNTNEPNSANAEVERISARVEELATQVTRLKILCVLSCIVFGVGIPLAGAVGWLGARILYANNAAAREFGRVEMGTIPVGLNRELAVTGVVEFSKPFSRKPLVFIAELGHAGVFLACKTDAISETQFTWAAGAGPMNRAYTSELGWIAIEPK